MTNANDDDELARAIALSLQEAESTLAAQNYEKEQLKLALAASLGKTPDQLTAREVLSLELEEPESEPISNKRPLSDVIPQHEPKVAKSKTAGNTRYWDGVVKLTHVTGFTGTTYIKFEDIIDKYCLKKAFVTAFVGSMEFINEHFPDHVNMCIVLHGRPAQAGQISPTRLVIHPPMKDDRYGVFHTKLMLLFHENSMRVVIGSGNLDRWDYKDLENVVFIQDFPQRSEPCSDLPPFANDICDLLDRMQVPASVKEELYKYDFAKAKAHIVASVSGVFEGDEHKKFGHTRLAEVVRELGVADPAHLPVVEMQTSSLGALTVLYMNELYRSFCGFNPYTDDKKLDLSKTEPPPVRIIYPSRDTVLDSRLGPSGADTICFNSSLWKKPTFPRKVMHDAISHRAGTLMHSKYIIATLHKRRTVGDPSLKGWVYCGSHNATMAAWGKLTLARDTKQPKMSISNWELGVVLPIYEDTNIPAPYRRPVPPYRPEQEPWMQDREW
ncbi:tyrosyl-DNA phosphodiesterase-domain-containing protein [Radiomyces spectabilis]|uniref:tyrosyl-DNA phosphodiesterase-domain-containing protein n=1 Tax=Radiomyces spectabilis TaxID=64574 RepID=UPI00221E58FD|nr:tyrosyl-DNA phosphodiesterase-domain-containing protein [Radiomyces spectabilis]KAI8377756.1 tyrosyl-DNA phosphodiesterase-domain-containing protein [Radiomyces spectabilis]